MVSCATQIIVTKEQVAGLRLLLRPSAQNRHTRRALIVLAACRGHSNQKIAEDLGISRETVRKWRTRWAQKGLSGLEDLTRSGRPPRFTSLQHAQVTAIACTSPQEKNLPLTRWSSVQIARQAVTEGIVDQISRFSVARWLAHDMIKPWQTRSWISPRDPCFASLGGVVLDLYQRRWRGRRLRDDEFVISADEKPGIQVLRRSTPTRALLPGRPRRVEFDYQRRGTLAYLAGMDVRTGQVVGVMDATTGIVPFSRLVDQVMTREPYLSARRVFWVVDNGSSHRGVQAQARLRKAYPRAVLVHTPVHASWLNQIEVFFSILSRKGLAGQSFESPDDLAERVLGFQDWYNRTAKPFNWSWTRTQLNDYLARLGTPDRTPPPTNLRT